MGSNFAAAKDGKIVAKNVMNNEKKEIINMYTKFISEGIWLKKYISSGKSLILNNVYRFIFTFLLCHLPLKEE